MPTLGSLPTDKPDLSLKFAWPTDPAAYATRKVASLTVVSAEQVRAGEPQRLQGGTLVLVKGSVSQRINGRTAEALEALLRRMADRQAAALVVSAPAEAQHVYPQSLRDLAVQLSMPLLVSSASLKAWDGVHDGIRHCRMMYAENHMANLDKLMQKVPEHLTDSNAMQRIADGLAHALDAQVLVSESERILAASPATAAEHLAQVIIRQSIDGAHTEGLTSPHTQLISLAPATGSDTFLAVSSDAPWDEADIRLIRHAASLLRLVDEARREYRAATFASLAARRVTAQLLMEGEPQKARAVMSRLNPGLLETDTVRAFVIEATAATRDSAVRDCETATAGRALVIDDPYDARRVLVIHPVHAADEESNGVAAELMRLVAALGPDASLGGSGLYSISLLSEALEEAATAQRFATHQPDSVTLSAQETEIVSLLPPDDAQRWARRLLAPLMGLPPDKWEPIRETLPKALAYGHTVAARGLKVHRNTVTRRVARAAELLQADFGLLAHRIWIGLALELVTKREAPILAKESGPAPTLESLLASPELNDWAKNLLRDAHNDRRDLLATATAWLECDAHIEPAAKTLGLSEVTVRSHLRALENLTSRDLGSLPGIRDLYLSLRILTGSLEVASCDAQIGIAA
ncbi:helix-turn-helix domain-containing protein [Streptomyces sp. NPDC002402]